MIIVILTELYFLSVFRVVYYVTCESEFCPLQVVWNSSEGQANAGSDVVGSHSQQDSDSYSVH